MDTLWTLYSRFLREAPFLMYIQSTAIPFHVYQGRHSASIL